MKDRFKSDDRGVSEVIGAILVFGLLIALLAVFQTQAIPAANQQVEFNHNQDVQGDLAKFHQTASEVANSGDRESLSIQAGTTYPSRLLFFNPSPASGSISTSDNQEVTITNAEASDPEVADYLNGDNVTLDSRSLTYDPNYNYLDSAPATKYEYGILYNQHRNSTTFQNQGSVIDDTDINLQFMAGSYARSSAGAQSLSVRPVSAPARPVTIESDDGDPIELVLPTELPEEQWEEIVDGQDTVTDWEKIDGEVHLELDGDRRYTMQIAGLGLEQGVEKPDAHYIVPADDGVSSLGAGDNTSVKYEVRDRYNNPVSGENVTVERPGEDPKTVTSDGEGRVAVVVSPDNPQNVPATISDAPGCEDGPDQPERCEAEFSLQTTDINPNPSTGVTLEEASTDVSFIDSGDNDRTMGLEFRSGEGEVKMERFRINHYHDDPSSMGNATLEDNDDNTVEDIEVGGSFVGSDELEEIIAVDEDGTGYALTFDSDVDSDDFVVMTIVFENGERGLYFASPDADNTLL